MYREISTKYLGPYKIVSAMGKDRYKVSRIGEHAGPRITTTSVDNMKRWLSSESDTSCSDISDDDIVCDENDNGLLVGHQGPMPSQNEL